MRRTRPGGARLRRPLAKGATFASYAVPMALRAVTYAGSYPKLGDSHFSISPNAIPLRAA